MKGRPQGVAYWQHINFSLFNICSDNIFCHLALTTTGRVDLCVWFVWHIEVVKRRRELPKWGGVSGPGKVVQS